MRSHNTTSSSLKTRGAIMNRRGFIGISGALSFLGLDKLLATQATLREEALPLLPPVFKQFGSKSVRTTLDGYLVKLYAFVSGPPADNDWDKLRREVMKPRFVRSISGKTVRLFPFHLHLNHDSFVWEAFYECDADIPFVDLVRVYAQSLYVYGQRQKPA